LLLLTAGPARAHDYWFMPETFFPAPRADVALRLHVGDHFVSEAERPFAKKPTLRFQLFHGKETLDLAPLSREDKTPFARVTVRSAGTHLIALDRASHLITLDADKFNRYLAEEGLDAVLAERRKAGEDKLPGRERYSRYLKSLLQVGAERDDTARKVLGQRLEIVPQANPYRLKPGDLLTVRVLFEGKPLAGARVFALRRQGDKTHTQKATTSAEGLATVKLDAAGPWLIRLVHLRRAVKDADADWESFWAALTFALK
jgi:hypothetical protein